MKAVTHLEKVIAGEVSAVTHLEKVIAQETAAVTYTEKVIAGEAPPITHLQKVIAGVARPVTHLEYVWAGCSPPSEHEYTGAVPVTFIADGTPLLDYIISGNTTQNGTPTTDSPIMPEGTGERTGNLFDYKTAYASYINADGDVAAASLGTICNSLADFVGQTVTIRVYCKTVTATRVYVQAKISGATKNSNGIYQGNTGYMTLTVTPETTDDYWIISYGSLGTGNNIYSDFMVNTGSTPLPYEPYGYKLDILSGGTTTPIYLGAVQTTRRVGKIDLGTLNWSKVGSGNFLADTSISNCRIIGNTAIGNAICTHFTEVSPNNVASTPHSFSSCLNVQARPFVNKTGFEDMTAAEFKEAMSGVYMYYVLATPETAVVNEPLMKIGDYADTLSMEQAGTQIPTANGSTTLDVETTVKPSEVYIKYRGEAVATLSALPAEVSSPEATEEVNPEEMEETENGSENVSLQHKPEAVE